MTLLIGKDLVVSIHYTLTNSEGEVLDSSNNKDPLTYLHGAGNIIPGLEDALVGKTQGDSLEVTVQPEQAYGLSHPELIQKIPHEMFEGVDTLEVGMVFQAESTDGQARMIEVTSIEEDGVTVDGNHPLAGQVLNFSVSVEHIREATAEELAHGHAQ